MALAAVVPGIARNRSARRPKGHLSRCSLAGAALRSASPWRSSRYGSLPDPVSPPAGLPGRVTINHRPPIASTVQNRSSQMGAWPISSVPNDPATKNTKHKNPTANSAVVLNKQTRTMVSFHILDRGRLSQLMFPVGSGGSSGSTSAFRRMQTAF